jgi:hypothetical protein
MTDRLRLPRVVVVVAAVTLVGLGTLSGCGRGAEHNRDANAVSPADRSAVNACAHATRVVNRALGAVLQVENGSLRAAGAGRRLTRIKGSLTALAASATDALVQQSVQDLVDSITAFLAVLPDRTVSAYGDAAADVKGRLVGFRQTCPVENADFATGTAGWSATTASTEISSAAAGRTGGPGLVLAKRGSDGSVIGVTDSPSWVPRTWRGSYRAGLWARSTSGSPTLTLVVAEKSGKAVAGEARRSVVLGRGWTFIGVGYDVTGRGGALDVRVTAAGVAPGAEVHIDGFALARG